MITPYPWQVEPINHLSRILGGMRSACDASDPGTGKTVVAVLTAKRLGARLGVVCPKSVIPAWKRTAELAGVGLAYCHNIEALKTGKTPFLKQEGSEWRLRLPSDVIPVFDEAHQFSGSHSSNGLICATAPQPTLHISATLTDSPMKMRALLHNLGKVPWNSWYGFCLGAGCLPNPLRFEGPDSVMEPIRSWIFPARGVRVKVADLGDLFPENQVRVELLPVKNERAADAYLETLTHSNDALEGETQLVPGLIERVRNDLEDGCSVIVFPSYRKTLALLQEEFGTEAASIYGMQPDREEQRLSFQRREKRVLLAMVQAGGVALDAHDTVGDAPRSTYLLPVFRSQFAIQALGRAPRAGAKSKVRQALVFPDSAYGRRVQDLLESKVVRLGIFNDGETGEFLWS